MLNRVDLFPVQLQVEFTNAPAVTDQCAVLLNEVRVNSEPLASEYFRPFIGSREFLQRKERYILHLEGISPDKLAKLPLTRERVAAVKKMRLKSSKPATRALADFSTEYEVSTVPTMPFLVIPKVSSERREYVPVGWLEPPTIPSDLVFVIPRATLTDFALLTSTMHMAWLRHVGGRLKSDYRYSIDLVYNTFPTPPKDANLSKLKPLAQSVLDARATYPDSTLATLYDPELMPANLRKVHQTLDRAVDRLYRRAGFTSERERIEHLFTLYEKIRAPLEARIKSKKRRKKQNKRDKT